VKSKVIAILEARAGSHLADLIERRGGVPMLAPALEEVPDVDPQAIAALISTWRADPFKVAVFQTGVGTRALFQATEALGLRGEFLELLAASTVVVRGPKPVGELKAQGVSIAYRASSPFTTATVLETLAEISVDCARVLIQRYGVANRELRDALEARGARVEEIATYRWALPRDILPLLDLLDALQQQRVDAIVFTSAIQMHNLHEVARAAGTADRLAALLNRCVVGSVGPVCSRALAAFGVKPTFEASPPKLGPLMTGLEEVFTSHGTV
jgi:uroporphyrinogen-III synthase